MSKTITRAQADAFVQGCRTNPQYWYGRVLGWPDLAAPVPSRVPSLTADQVAIVQSVQTHRRTAVASGVGTGKTWIAAAEGLRFLHGHKPSIVLTTGPGAEQVEKQLWRDIRQIHGASKIGLAGELLTKQLNIGPDWFMLGLSPAVGQQEDTAVRLHGYHAPFVMVIIDEATGVEAPIIAAAEDITVGPHDRILALFNPTDPTSAMRRAWESGRWNRLTISGRNHPNVLYDDPSIVPGAITRGWIADHESDPLACAVIDGQWPQTGQHGLIPETWVQAAEDRWREIAAQGHWAPVRYVGADVGAGTGGDASTIARLCGWAIRDIQATSDEDTQATEGRIIAACRSNGPNGPWPLAVVDAIGIGAGVVDALRADGWPVLPFVAGAMACYPGSDLPMTDRTGTWRFADCRAAAWWALRECLDPQNGVPFALPPDPDLRTELTALHFFPISGGRYRVESKQDVRKRLGRSTDKADAVIHALWGTLTAETEIVAGVPDRPLALNAWDGWGTDGGSW